MFRRGSDTLLLTHSTHHQQQSSPNLAHRDRSAQLVPDDTMQAMTIVRRIGKGQEVGWGGGGAGLVFDRCVHAEVEQWNEDDVRQWLEGIGMAEYTSTFIQRNIVGRELLKLRKSDLQVHVCVCVCVCVCACVN